MTSRQRLRRPVYHNPVLTDLKSNIVQDILLSLLTCGIYAVYWRYKEFKGLNTLLEEQKYSFVKWYLLTLLTLGIYNFFVIYGMAKDLSEIQASEGMTQSKDLPAICLILSIVGLEIVTSALLQQEINGIIDALNSKHARRNAIRR